MNNYVHIQTNDTPHYNMFNRQETGVCVIYFNDSITIYLRMGSRFFETDPVKLSLTITETFEKLHYRVLVTLHLFR